MENRKRVRVQKMFLQPSLTKQSFKDQCDFNKVVKRFMRTGVLDHRREGLEPRYADLIGSVDYQTALGRINEAKASFGALPAKVRKRFDNDPVQFLDFVSDPKNVNEMVELGLAKVSKAPNGATVVAQSPPPPCTRVRGFLAH